MTIISIPMAKVERRNKDSASVALAWLFFFLVHQGFHSVSRVWKNESHFPTWPLSFELYLHKHHVFLSPSKSEKPKNLWDFSNAAFWKKGRTIAHVNCHLINQHLSCRMDSKSYLKFHMKKVVLLIYRLVLAKSGFGKQVIDLEPSGIYRCFGAWCSVRETYSTYMLHFWYPSIDIHSIMLRV
jgi:hypothetical protein